ncbi:hypothetical protein [Arthrobacter sp. L77]|uniref:hypothetical protein n=1 Tax=Arthrobacter sp. L77 TaxID=1496689 RepID=UPI0005B91F7E|nr:hypothetical protein [Arthrobacter sp. L77]
MTGGGPQSTPDPRYEGIYQRGGVTDASAGTGSPAPVAPVAEPPGPGTSVIREVGPEPGVRATGPAHPRNPYDPWVWGVAGVLVALGTYLLAAPMIHAEQYAEAMTSVQMGPYAAPWFSYVSMAAPILLMLGVATAVVQLFVLSVRHTLTGR